MSNFYEYYKSRGLEVFLCCGFPNKNSSLKKKAYFSDLLYIYIYKKKSSLDSCLPYHTCSKSTSPPIPANPHPLRETHWDLLLAAQMPPFLLISHKVNRVSWILSSLKSFVQASNKNQWSLIFSIMCFSSASLVYNRQLGINLFRWSLFHHNLSYQINIHWDSQQLGGHDI